MSIVSQFLDARLFSLRIGAWRFAPGVFMTLVFIFVLYILISLGRWQIARGEYREHLQQTLAQRQHQPPVPLSHIPDSHDAQRYLPVFVHGHYDAQHQFLLDNRVVDGKVGYLVLTPFITDTGRALLVNRGFIALGKHRDTLPAIPVEDTPQRLTGMLVSPPSHGLILDAARNPQAGWPRVLQFVEPKELSAMLGYKLMDMVLLLDKGQNGALKYDLPVLNLNSKRNFGYAFQWFAMAFTVCLLYLFLNTKKCDSTIADTGSDTGSNTGKPTT